MMKRKLDTNDFASTEAFLSTHIESSMFLLSNMRRSGLEYDDQPFHANYYASLDDDGRVAGVLAHCWNGNIILQVPDPKHLPGIVSAFREDLSRPIAGVLGPSAQASPTLKLLELQDAAYAINVSDGLFALELDQLIPPAGLLDEDFATVNVMDCDPHLIGKWIKGFEIEALGKDDDEALDKSIASRIARLEQWRDLWVMTKSGVPVAMSGFSARLADIVQVGAVWTPPGYRGRHYARTIVAATLQQARTEGVERAVLFANNPAAIRSYEALGFERTDTYQIAMLKQPIAIQ